TAPAMTACRNCGAPLRPGATFCTRCGTPVVTAPVTACPNCGRAVDADDMFCPQCGTRLPQAAAATMSPPATTVSSTSATPGGLTATSTETVAPVPFVTPEPVVPVVTPEPMVPSGTVTLPAADVNMAAATAPTGVAR